MTTSAWIFLVAVWGLILINTFYCFFRLLTSTRKLEGDTAPPTEPKV